MPEKEISAPVHLPKKEVFVWTLFIRFFHWVLVAAFAVDYYTAGKPFWLHKYAGIIIFILIWLRVCAGFWGSAYARFRDFIYGPPQIWNYLINLLLLNPKKRYIGHSPAGGAMVLALIVCLLATSGVGLSMYISHTYFDFKLPHGFKVFHATMAQVTMVLVVLHILGVALASYVHKENLIKSMITGWKRKV